MFVIIIFNHSQIDFSKNNKREIIERSTKFSDVADSFLCKIYQCMKFIYLLNLNFQHLTFYFEDLDHLWKAWNFFNSSIGKLKTEKRDHLTM